jgi:hypothetical protein
MSVPTALLANEAGIGRGHIVKLKQVASQFGPRIRCVAGLGRTTFSAELAPFCAQVLQAPSMHFTPEAVANPLTEGTATWADYLAAMGLAREAVVRRHLRWWRKQIIAQNASVLVTDYAPLAMRAAQGLQDEGWEIQIVSTGTGYGVPPADLPCFPQLLPDYSRVIHPEADLLALLNRVGAEQRCQPLTHLPAIYRADVVMAETFEFLDPYRKVRPAADRVPPTVPYAPAIGGTGDEVFVYFPTANVGGPAVVEALCALPLPRRGYFPEAPPALTARLAAAGVIIEPAPVSVAKIAERSRMVLHFGQHGTICMAALSGLPQMALPMQLEQLFHARRAGQQGVLDLLDWNNRRTDWIVDKVRQIYDSKPMQARAEDFARELRSHSPPEVHLAKNARLTAVVDRAIALAS